MTNEPTPATPAETGPGPGYEVRDTNIRAVVTFLVGLTLFIIVVQVFLWGLLRGIAGPRAEQPPGLTTSPMIPQLLHDLRQHETAVLAGKTGGVPIEEAMRQLAEKGIAPSAADRTEADVIAGQRKPPAAAPGPNHDRPRTQP